MNAVVSSRGRMFRFGLTSLILLLVLLAAGALVVNSALNWADIHSAIEVDGETVHFGAGDPLQWLMAGIGLVIAFVVVLLIVPIVLVVVLALPVLALVALLAVPLLIAAVVLSPILLLLWLLWKLVS